MRILHVIGDLAPQSGGPAKACIEMARAVAARGHDLTIFATNFGQPDAPAETRQDGVTLRLFPLEFPKIWLSSRPLGQALKHEVPSFDLVHVHSLYLYHDWAAFRACRSAKKPYIVRPHGTLDPYIFKRHRLKKRIFDLWFQDRMLRHAAAIHYTADEERSLAEPYVQGAPGFVVPNGINVADYAALPPRGSFRARYPQIGDAPVILFMARINFKKGLDILANALGQLRQNGRDHGAWLVIAGPDGGYMTETKNFLSQAGVMDRTLFPGMVRGDDKLALLADADIFTLPSYSENFGIAVVEAMATGLPVILSDRVNIWREVVADGAGSVTPPEARSLADQLALLLANPAKRSAMGAAGKRAAAARYDWAKVGAQLEEAYRRVLAGEVR